MFVKFPEVKFYQGSQSQGSSQDSHGGKTQDFHSQGSVCQGYNSQGSHQGSHSQGSCLNDASRPTAFPSCKKQG